MVFMALTHRWRRALLIPCVALTAAALQHTGGVAEAAPGRRMTESKLTESQKMQLFQARRNWGLRSYDQRLALLKSGKSCLERAQTPEAGKTCMKQQKQARRRLMEQGRQVVNAERRRLGLTPLPDFRRQGRGRS
ncbi:hypothetical protein MITS9509_02277 [Synechococcus sp. MIT S9509]|uniref:hypothetical protein n=2 Tax=Synechococcus TaxID=1129 RepID=UPI0007BBC6BF|nr:hypothetical protein [Synechococcus sp. MIT S9504]KZR86104.1 hypothetical protein MITS9504_01510 [Synechococcus sp. MIT S9504]KZR91641.1 hypothetical protein MITS9509_02277 [Synechococcus sp. MIT S9509]